jgi:Zn-finger nucleic acid-binding protein
MAEHDDVERVLSCPVCGQAMEIKKKRGIAVDVCPDHGIWFDAGEFEAAVARIKRSRPSRADVSRARKSGKMSGALFGWWALLGD